MDMQLPDAGLLQVQDAETGKIKWVDSSNELVSIITSSIFCSKVKYVKIILVKQGQICCMYVPMKIM